MKAIEDLINRIKGSMIDEGKFEERVIGVLEEYGSEIAEDFAQYLAKYIVKSKGDHMVVTFLTLGMLFENMKKEDLRNELMFIIRKAMGECYE